MLRRLGRQGRSIACLIGVWVICADFAQAGNGLNLIGFGTESVGMGGADLAVARDTSALNSNPAGLTQLETGWVDLYSAVAFAREVSHQDRFGDSGNVTNSPIFFGDVGYAQRIAGTPLVLGVGLFAQGGAGVEFSRINTPFGTRDELASLFRIAKLMPGVAWEVSPGFSLGAALAVTYADMEQRVFPDTSAVNPAQPEQSFFGYELEGAEGTHVGANIGAAYVLSETVTLAAAYSNAVDLEMSGGKAVFDFSAVGLGKVMYRDVSLKGLQQPQVLGVGVAFRPSEQLLLAFDASWIDWSDAVKSATFRAGEPDRDDAPPVLVQTTRFDWRDQYVFALGAAYETGRLVLRAGYNYGRNPVPQERTTPLLAPIAEHHVTLGAGYRLSRIWRIDGAIAYEARATVTYTNPDLPFGPDVRQTNEVVSLHLTLSRNW